jgi:hypothetical protein
MIASRQRRRRNRVVRLEYPGTAQGSSSSSEEESSEPRAHAAAAARGPLSLTPSRAQLEQEAHDKVDAVSSASSRGSPEKHSHRTQKLRTKFR